MKKVYGCTETHLKLSKEAQAVYNDISPIEIIEIETDDGEYLYNVDGCIQINNLTAERLNDFLVGLKPEEE